MGTISPETISLAQSHLDKRQMNELKDLRQHYLIVPKTIPHLTESQLIRMIAGWSSWHNSLLRLADTTYRGNEAAALLQEAQGIIQTYYFHPRVQEFLAEKPVVRKNGYDQQIAAQVSQDRGHYWQVLADLSSDHYYLKRASESYAQAVSLTSPAEGNIRPLAMMEKWIVDRKRGERLTEDILVYLYRSMMLAPQVNWATKATVSLWIMREGLLLRDWQCVEIGFEQAEAAVSYIDVSLLKNYLWPGFLGHLRAVSRRRTFSGDPKKLEL